MLKFEKSFFHDEVRDGFYVSSMMKRCWAANMTVFQEIVDICGRNGLRIFADCGTLLGAARHSGFVPWDDDMDALILRDEYDLFRETMNRELPEGWRFLENDSKKDHFFQPWCRIVSNTEFLWKDEDLEAFHGFRYRSGVDIFPLEYMASDEGEIDVLKVLYDLMLQLCFTVSITEDEFEERLRGIEELLNVKVERGNIDEIKSSVLKMVMSVISSYTQNESDVMVRLTTAPYGKKRYSPDWFADTEWLPFENIRIPVPCGYDKVLGQEYGDYMKKIRRKGAHDYPYFKKDIDVFEEKTGLSSAYTPGKEIILKDGAVRIMDKDEDRDRKVVFFLPYTPSTWKYMAEVWERCVSDENATVIVMPIPYFEKHYSGRLEEQIYITEGYPEEVEITKLSEVNIEAYDIDEIYIQCPFDERNTAMSVHPYFYAPHLRKMCRQLIYVQDFEIDEFDSKDDISYATFDSFLEMPGVVYSDITVVQSERMKRLYVDHLSAWSGEDTREHWNSKLVAREVFLANR